MKRRSFIKGVAAAGAASLLPSASVGAVLSGCSKQEAGTGWDFDEIIDRSGTWSIKQGRAGKDQLAMWIADMDFKTDPKVSRALKERLDRDVMGYTSTPDEFFEAIRGWLKDTRGYDLPVEWIGYAPGVITAINQAYLAFSEPGDRIIVQPPVYDPLWRFGDSLGREMVDNPLVLEDGKFRMDLEGLEKLIDGRTRILVLCNPHNPIGILWDRETLSRLADICDRHGLIVISDEIHGDLALYGRRHNPFCSVSETAARVGMMFAGPTKAFNIAGLYGTAYCVIPDKEKREKYLEALHDRKLSEPSVMTLVAMIAAYTGEQAWLSSLKEYLQGNIELVMDYFSKNDLGIVPIRPEASFLVWLDCRKRGLKQPELVSMFNEKAGVIINDGSSYGVGGEGFIRLNIGCPRAVLKEALERIGNAFA